MDVISSAKTDMFRMRINPEVRQNLEAVYAKNGLTLTDAGFPFQVTEGNAELIKAKALNRLMKELNKGISDSVSYSEDEVYQMLGVEK